MKQYDEWNEVKKKIANNFKSKAFLVQGRLFDVKRLENKIGMISISEFKELLNV